MVIDFRIRPPAKSFLGLSILNKGYKGPTRMGVEPAPSFMQDSMDLLIEEMQEAGIVKGVIMGRQSAPVYGSVPNDEIAEILKEYPGHFEAFGGVNLMDIKAAVAEVDRAIKELSFKGIAVDPGWSEVPMTADDRRVYPIYAKCDELGVPVAITTSIYVGPDISYSLPASLHRVAKDFPSLNIVVPHAAWPWVNEMLGVAFASTNIWLAPDFYLNIPNMPGATHYVEAANYYLSDRLIYASSYPVRPLKESIEEFKSRPINDEAKEKALYKNAARLLKLDISS
jgi:predicted TIM-barrel fold metal-dependent hydrolase